jgi:hypothetical protein
LTQIAFTSRASFLRTALAVLAVVLAASLLLASTSSAAPPPSWTLQETGTSPSGMGAPSMAYDPAIGKVVLFGGRDHDGSRDETWTYDGETWAKAEPATSPPARFEGSMVYDPAIGEIVLFGGIATVEGETIAANDTWTYDGTTWTELKTAASPLPLEAPSMAYDPATKKIVLFGGYWSGERQDTWTFDGKNWIQAHPSTSPSGRFGGSMAYDPGTEQMVLFGGNGLGGVRNDTWIYNGTTWTEAKPSVSPPGRLEGSMAYDPTIGRLVLFGGYGRTNVLSDTWTYDGTTWTEAKPSMSPPGRFAAGMTYDSAFGHLVLFGGGNGVSYLDETWAYRPIVGPPSATISSPGTGGTYTVGAEVATAFQCQEAAGGPGLESCIDSGGAEASGGSGTGTLDTSTVGEHTYSVAALSEDGEEAEAHITYTVVQATPTLTTKASADASLGGAISDTATIAGGHLPGGTVTFRAYGPDDATCATTPAYVSAAVQVSGDGEYDSGSFVPTAIGTYRWIATYTGDAGNEGKVGACGDADESVTVTKAVSATALAVSPDPADLGAAVTLSAKVSGAHPTGSVTFSDGATTLATVTLDASGSASYSTAGLAAGPHALKATYAGDAANLASASPSVEETILAPSPTPEPSPTPAPAPSPEPAPAASPTPTPTTTPASTPTPTIFVSYNPNHKHSPNPRGGARYTFHFKDPVPGTSFLCSLDGSPFEACNSSVVYRHLKPGRHVLRVKSVNTTGAESPTEKIVFQAGKKPGRR